MINNIFLKSTLYLTCIFVLVCFSCDEHNVHGDSIGKGQWKVIQLENQDSTSTEAFQQLPGAHMAFNICMGSMNDDWGTDREQYGECTLVISHQIDNQFTQDEYRFHIRNEESLVIKLLPDHSDLVLPDLTGPYTYEIDGRNMVLSYTGTENPELEDLEIHCWDWSPE